MGEKILVDISHTRTMNSVEIKVCAIASIIQCETHTHSPVINHIQVSSLELT